MGCTPDYSTTNNRNKPQRTQEINGQLGIMHGGDGNQTQTQTKLEPYFG